MVTGEAVREGIIASLDANKYLLLPRPISTTHHLLKPSGTDFHIVRCRFKTPWPRGVLEESLLRYAISAD